MHRRLPTVSVFLCLAAGVLMRPAQASAQSTELFFSEYVEGSSFNKALEIYNGTGSDVDLAARDYNIQMFFNGSSSAALTIDLTGTIANTDVFVITQTAASQALRDLADQIHLSSSWFNGDDAIVLRKGSTIVDVIGQIGVDPGSEWGWGVTSTQDNTIRRKSSVLAGDQNGSDAFDPALEWAGFAQDTFSGLGSHNVVPPFQTKHIWEINVHQRSLSGVEAADGRVRARRHAQALELSQFIDSLQDAQPEMRLVAIGDFNAFEFTDGYVDVMGQVTGSPDPAGALLPATDEISQDLTNQTRHMPADQRYSFVFDGTAQSLDHAITSQGLDPFVRGAQHARGNADAPFDYDEVADTALRSSDHDGTVLFLTTDLDSDGVPDSLDACADTRIPEGVPTDRLNPNHYALVDGDRTFDTTAPPGRAGRITPFSIADTASCSCEQILDRIGEAEVGERNFGCSPGTIRDWLEGR